MSRLRRIDVNHPALVDELAEVQANHDYEMSLGKATYLECFQPPLRKRLLTGIGLQALQQLTGKSDESYPFLELVLISHYYHESANCTKSTHHPPRLTNLILPHPLTLSVPNMLLTPTPH